MSNPSITADKTPWYQWDTGLTVTVSGGEMTECHFANRKQGTAYVQAVINGVARVPDELLQVAAPIKAYGYVSDGAGGQTYIEQTFEVIARNIPTDYTYTKTAQKTIRDAEVARDQAVQAAKDAKASELAADDSAVDASNSAQSAGDSASAAATSASNAANSAGEAADAASSASVSASAAEQSATDANSAKVAAQTAKAEAERAKGEAATSASNAATSATAAAKSASDAAASVDETLTEAKKYTDANTSNALVGTVSGKLLHVEDAWPGKPLSLTIEGACKQDGTPSPDNPVQITVIENPVLKITGADTSAGGASITITLPAEHPYLAALPDGTADTIEVDKDGNVSLIARVVSLKVPDEAKWTIQEQLGGYSLGYTNTFPGFESIKKGLKATALLCNRFVGKSTWDNAPCFGVSGVLWVVPRTNQSDITREDVASVANGMKFYAPLITPVTYNLGKLEIPSLPETISNVCTEAELTTNMSMTYKRDINIAFGNLVQAVVAAAAGE